MIRFLITGAPYSGTLWAAQALTAAGMGCQHETACSSWTDEYGDDGWWLHSPNVGESAAQGAPFTQGMRQAGVVVVRLMRHPLLVAGSLVGRGLLTSDRPIRGFYATHTPGFVDHPEPADAALRFWIDWNTQVDCDVTWRLPLHGNDLRAFAGRINHARPFDADRLVKTPATHQGPRAELGEYDFAPLLWRQALDMWHGQDR